MAMQGRPAYKANNIEILNMRHLTEKWQPGKPSEQIVLLHEMCHAVHSHILGNKNPIIMAAYNQAMDRQLYQDVKHESGRSARAYASTSDHEYFAELSCAYLDRCAWYPFTREELKEYDAVGFKLMEEIWTDKDPRGSGGKKTPKTMSGSGSTASKPSPPAKPAPSGANDEAAATRKLDLIDSLLKADRKDKAREKLKELIDAHPGTDAAKKAQEILDGLK
jgi:hypothetical protein